MVPLSKKYLVCPPMDAVAEDSGGVRYTVSHLKFPVSKFVDFKRRTYWRSWLFLNKMPFKIIYILIAATLKGNDILP